LRRVLKEGGCEPVESMIHHGRPGLFSESVEDTVICAVRQVLQKMGAR